MKTRGVLSADEICRILTSAGASGVSKLKFGGLEIEFGYPAQQNEASGTFPTLFPSPEPLDPEVQSQELKDFEQAQELITDPASHEENMIREASEG